MMVFENISPASRHGVILGIHVSFQGWYIHAWAWGRYIHGMNFHHGMCDMKLALGCQACSYCCVACLCGLIRWDVFCFFFTFGSLLWIYIKHRSFHELWDNAYEYFHYKLEYNLKLQKEKVRIPCNLIFTLRSSQNCHLPNMGESNNMWLVNATRKQKSKKSTRFRTKDSKNFNGTWMFPKIGVPPNHPF